MIRRGLLACTLAAVAVSLAVPRAAAQDDPFFKKVPNPGESRVRANEMRDGKRIVKGPDEAKHKADLLIMAKSLVYPATDPSYASAPEPDPKQPTVLRPAPIDLTFKARLDDLDRYILKPTINGKFNFDQYDYIVEFGNALNLCLAEVLVPEAPATQRVNAARLLALAAKSGAPAHAAMITNLIANTETPPEVLIYALQAAQNLLSAFDPRQVGGVNASLHTLKNDQLVKLILAIEKVVVRQTPYGPKPAEKKAPMPAEPEKEAAAEKPEEKPAPPPAKKDGKAPPTSGKLEASVAAPFTPEQGLVIRFFRRDAIRALAAVRYPSVTDAKTNVTARPLYTLCRIAVNDGPFAPALGPDEYADAVLGLIGLHSLKGVDVDTVLNCIAIGTGNYARRKAGSNDISIAWKIYATSLNAACNEWLQAAGQLNNSRFAGKPDMTAGIPKFTPLMSLLSTNIFAPLEQLSRSNPTVTINLEALQQWMGTRKLEGMTPYTDLLPEDKAKLTLKPVFAN